ncbi:DUF4174 domain-containing protein [Arcticibacter eurypsychrophilus]|uniref:DUF4174 domain-containing protein n=1 Tax=Arcticibacter eurypsychrophilus TaxID=1434752 RepID=UPI00084D1618|nr:DUF4174 domain-containing protein [Arcticibacter eurypsychrophilus]
MKIILVIILSVLQISSAKRVLNIYATDKQDKSYREQIRVLAADPIGMQERDLILKEHFGSIQFKITLIGKDGGEKYSTKSVLTLEKLYALIDAMPMRKHEKSKK